ncbi:hypothetical protein [Pectobacterium odoriferum]|uniref:hypothetical protein n=1 Tax=Pectobacterium odoriferum TaxID=78398 RepID=UPI000CD2716B|nr:hypothetical protein [Pectobacterium odoriferum]POE04644.1 hypothetical protein BV916_11915 [Pectobacterium odoriferum]
MNDIEDGQVTNREEKRMEMQRVWGGYVDEDAFMKIKKATHAPKTIVYSARLPIFIRLIPS